MSTKKPASKKARALQRALGADPLLCNVSFMIALGWVNKAGSLPWDDWPAFVEACRAKAHKVAL
jgi:hypothetical protein